MWIQSGTEMKELVDKMAQNRKSTTASKSKKLTIDVLKNEINKVYEATKIVTINGYKIKVKKKFNLTDTHEIVDEMFISMREMSDMDIINVSRIIQPFLSTLIIKHFTDIDIPDTTKEQIAVMEMLIDNQLLKPIMESFDKEELTTLYNEISARLERITDISNVSNEMMEEMNRFDEEITEDVKSRIPSKILKDTTKPEGE